MEEKERKEKRKWKWKEEAKRKRKDRKSISRAVRAADCWIKRESECHEAN